MPHSATNRDQNITFDHIFLLQDLLFWQNNYTYFFKKYHQFWVMTDKVTFSTTKKYPFRKIAYLHPKPKKIGVSFIWKLKAKRFQNPLDLHYTITKEFGGRNYFANLDNAVLLPKQNALSAPLLDIKPFLPMKKWKHFFKWPTPLEWYDRDSLLSLVWGCQHI